MPKWTHDAGAAALAFDRLAPRYDELWTHSTIGRLQREAVWREASEVFRPGDRVLDLGCGTGEDALRLERRGVAVTAIDVSPEMVSAARARGVHARVLAIEDLDSLDAPFDGAISNFGALNCVRDLGAVGRSLAGLVRPGGHLVICTMSRFCLGEMVHYLLRLQPRKAFRRLGRTEWRSVRVYYPGAGHLERAFAPAFRLTGAAGIGIDRRIARWPVARSIGDHRLMIFRRS